MNLLAAALTLIFVGAAGPARAEVIALTGGTLIDGNGGPAAPSATVVIKDGRIIDIGADAAVPAGARVISLKGKWILPGLIDAHVHLGDGGFFANQTVDDPQWAAIVAGYNARSGYILSRYLCAGVTSIADVGGTRFILAIRDQANHSARSPRMFAAGLMLSTFADYYNNMFPKGLPLAVQLTNETESREAVDSAAELHPDFLKLQMIPWDGRPIDPKMPLEEVRRFQAVLIQKFTPAFSAAVDEAHRRNLRALAHSQDLASHKAAAKSRADAIIHSVYDAPVDDELIGLLKGRNIPYVPTLAVFVRYAQTHTYPPVLDLLPIETECATGDALKSFETVPPGSKMPEGAMDIAVAKANLKKLTDSGALIAMGTDTGNPGMMPGGGAHREMLEMAGAGMSPMQIIVAATKNGAATVGNPHIGILEPGKFADILVVNADPLADIRNLGKIEFVMKEGKIFNHSSFLNESPDDYPSFPPK